MIQTGQCFKDIYPVIEAFDTLRQRAKAGDATAQYRLSLRHLAGVHQNRREADYWLQQAAENGDLDAQYWLGQHYYHGSRGFPKTPKPRTNGWTKQQRRADAIPAIKSA